MDGSGKVLFPFLVYTAGFWGNRGRMQRITRVIDAKSATISFKTH